MCRDQREFVDIFICKNYVLMMVVDRCVVVTTRFGCGVRLYDLCVYVFVHSSKMYFAKIKHICVWVKCGWLCIVVFKRF